MWPERHREIWTFLAATLLAVCLPAPNVPAQSPSETPSPSDRATSVALSPEDGPAKGSHEWQVWLGGGEPVQIFSGAPDARIWTVGVSYGWVLTGAHGPGLLRGRFEWAGDLVPVLEVLEPRGRSTAGVSIRSFGGGISSRAGGCLLIGNSRAAASSATMSWNPEAPRSTSRPAWPRVCA